MSKRRMVAVNVPLLREAIDKRKLYYSDISRAIGCSKDYIKGVLCSGKISETNAEKFERVFPWFHLDQFKLDDSRQGKKFPRENTVTLFDFGTDSPEPVLSPVPTAVPVPVSVPIQASVPVQAPIRETAQMPIQRPVKTEPVSSDLNIRLAAYAAECERLMKENNELKFENIALRASCDAAQREINELRTFGMMHDETIKCINNKISEIAKMTCGLAS